MRRVIVLLFVCVLMSCWFLTAGCNEKPAADTGSTRLSSYLKNLADFPSSFRYGESLYQGFGKDFTETGRDTKTEGDKEYTTVTLLHSDKCLEVRIEAVAYHNYNACEWTLYFTNTGNADTATISDINGADINFKGENPVIKGINGDSGALYSYYETDVSVTGDFSMKNESGRPTHGTFPYYNLEYGTSGVCIAVGWPGCFRADFSYKNGITNFKGGLADFSAYLKPGETARSPLAAFVFYEKRDENIAMNAWRQWFIHCNMPGTESEEIYDIIIIHDGIRPLIDQAVLSDVIIVCQKYGNAITSMPYNEQIFVMDDEISTTKYIPRETLRRVSTPQAYRYGKLNWAYHTAFDKKIGIYGSSYTNTMMVELGERLYFASGSDKNIKLTTKDDLDMFKAYLKMNHSED